MIVQKYPFLLSPAGKDYLWGGENLKHNYSKKIDLTPLAETWECSCHPDAESVVANGEYKGKTLTYVLEKNSDWVGECVDTSHGFPVLFKLIDAKKRLSVQVHPDDDYALSNENELGKTEMWYVLDAAPDSEIIYGFKNKIDRETLIRSAEDGTIMKHLRSLKAKCGDVFFITPGTVHAIGAGITIAEIQQSSNITYRLYDFGRRDVKGNLRPLHIEQAADVADYSISTDPKDAKREAADLGGAVRETLAECKYFKTDKISVTREYKVNIDNASFCVFFCAKGNGSFLCGKDNMKIQKGNTFFFPAGIGEVRFTGELELLGITC